MSQNDFNIANQGHPSFRSDLNSALLALASNSAGTSAPATTYAYMWWYDSTNNVLKMRNADNDAWINFASFDQATDTFTITTDNIDGLTATAAELNKLDGVTNDAASYFAASGALSNRNLIINGAMAISQRYGTSASNLGGSSVFSVDRFNCFGPSAISTSTGQQVTDTPAGFKNSLKYTCGTGLSVTSGDYAQIQQTLEGNNTAHLKWGTSDAQDIVVSFWVKSSLTGTFAFNIQNGDFSRSYVAQYQINATNTWEYKTIAVAGDTSGTWATDNTASLRVMWDMGFGYGTTSTVDAWQAGDVHYVSGNVKVNETSGATFYITGVQLEVGDTATPFEHRSFGQELALCQRYYQVIRGGSNRPLAAMNAENSVNCYGVYVFNPEMRTAPSFITSGNAGDYVLNWSSSYTLTSPPVGIAGGNKSIIIAALGVSLPTNGALQLRSANSAGELMFDAEL